MPTVREIIADDKARGVPEEKTRALLVKHGISDEDFGLDLPTAKAKGAARLAARAAPPVPAATPPKALTVARPLPEPATPVGLPEPATAPASVTPAASRVGPPADFAEWARRKVAAAAGVAPMFGAVDRERQATAAAEDRIEYPTPGRVVERSREMALGGVLGLGGDTRTAQAVKAIKAVGEAAPTFLEDVTGAFGLVDPPLIGRSKAEREKQLGAAVATQLKPLAKSLTDTKKAAFVETADTSRFTKPFEAMERERQTRRVGGTPMEATHRFLVNAKDDIANVVNSLAHLAGEVGGVTVLEPGETTASRAAKVGAETATGLVGATGSLVKGLKEGTANPLYTHPLTTVLTFLPMVKAASLAAKPSAAAAMAKVRGIVAPVVDTAVMDAAGFAVPYGGKPLGGSRLGKFRMPDNLARVAAQWGDAGMNPSTLANALAAVKRALADGVVQADPRATAIVDDIIHAPEQAAAAIRNLVERAARQVEQGKVRPVRPQLERAELRITPAADDAAAATAERVAVEAAKQAGEIRGRADAAAQAAGETRALRRDVEGAQRQAVRSQGQIAQASQAAEAVMEQGFPRVAAAAETPNAAFLDVADATVSLADRIERSAIPKIAKDEIAASRAAKAFDRAHAEYLDAARQIGIDPTEFRKQYAALAAEDLGKASERLAAKQVVATPAAEARAAALELAKEGRAAERIAYSRLVAFERAQAALGAEVGRVLDKTRAQAGKAAAAGLRAAEAVQAVEPKAAAQMAQESAALQRAPAAKAERVAAAAEDVAERAGVRPEVYAGDVYLPPEHAALPPSGTGVDPVLRIADLEAKDALGRPLAARPLGEVIPETPTEILDAVRRESQKVGDLQAAEAAAGFDADARVFAGPLAEMGLPPYTRMGEAGRAFAADVVGRNLDNPQAVIAERLRQLGAERGATEAAARLLAEQELLQQTKRIDTAFGAIRRPTPVITEYGMAPSGEIAPMPRAASGQLRAALDEASGARESLETGAPRRARQEGLEMGGGRTLQPEAPRSTTTDNPIFNAAANDIAKRVRDVYFPSRQLPALEIGEQPLKFQDLLTEPTKWDAAAQTQIKRLSDLRIRQRLGEALADDTAQLIRSKSVQRSALDEFSRRLQAAGFGRMSKPWRQAMGDFAERLRDPELASAISKNRFFEVKAPDGTPLWGRQDFIDIQRAIPAERLASVRAEVLRSVGDQMAEATHAYGVMREMGNELYRFYKTPTGEVLPEVPGNPGAYVLEVARRVLKDGEIAPQMMPYSGAKMFSMLSGDNAAVVASKVGVPVAKVESLGRYLRDYASAGGDKGLSPALGSWWSQVFQHTDPPGELVNMHVNPGVADSLRAHFFMLAASDAAGPAMGLAREIFQRSKAGVVAENLKSLVNNNLSNTMLQSLRRGDPSMLGNIVLAPLQFKAYMDGNLSRLSPADVRMYKALSGTNIVQGAQLSRELGKSRLWEAFGKQFTGAKKAIERADVVTGGVGSKALEPISNLQDALREAYTSLGDMPFRLEEATAVFRDADAKVRMLKPGESLTVQTGPGKHTLITRVGDGVEIQHRGGSRATRPSAQVGLDSPELAQALADAANVAQERVFFDYSKIGNLGKTLRGSVFTGLSGIFSWFFKATDIPGIKRGLLSEMVSGPSRFATTSPAVRSLQTQQYARLAAARAMLVQAGMAAYADQRRLTDAPGAVAYDPATKGMILARSTNPEHMMVRNVAPLQFGAPTGVAAGALADVAGWLAFRNIMNNPDDLEALLKDPPPETKLDPDTLRRRQLLRDHASGKNFSRKQALQLIGLGGGPIMQILDKLDEQGGYGKPYTAEDGLRDFGYAMFGATPSTLLNVGAAGLYEAGVDSALPWSSYGKELRSHAFAGGVAGKDEAGFLQWALRSLLDVGWQQILFDQYAYKQNVATGGSQAPRAKAALQDVSRVLKGTLLQAAEQRAVAAAEKYGANSAEHQKALNLRINITEGINALVRQMGENIAADANALGISGVATPTVEAKD